MGNDGRSVRATREHMDRASTVIDEVGAALDIPDQTIQTATVLYRQLLNNTDEHEIWRIHEVAITAVFIACQIEGIPRKATEFANIEEHPIEREIVLRRAKTIKDTLGIEVTGNTNPALHIDRWEDDLEVSDSIIDKAKKILQECRDAGIDSGKRPSAWAAAAIYSAVAFHPSEKMTQREISQICGVSKVTIQKSYKEQIDFYADT